MTQRFTGKTALVSGVARGQGRSHALKLASEGANIIGFDIARQLDTVPYPLATPEDLDRTRRDLEACGVGVHLEQADVRDGDAVAKLVAAGVDRFSGVDIVVANAGISPEQAEERDPNAIWHDVIEINVTGVRNTVHAAVHTMIDRGNGGAIVLTSSVQGLSGRGGTGTAAGDAYVASKHAVTGLMRTWANWLAPHGIRVNSLHPCGVDTPMVMNDALPAFFEKYPASAASLTNLLPVEVIDAKDVSNALAWLVSDEARYITGVALPVDAGFLVK